jgi:CRP/FNR family cyclic AMP-dependent transcriptional regulator
MSETSRRGESARVKADAEILSQIPLFAGAEAAHLQLLAFTSTRVELEAEQILFRKGDKGAAAYLVLEGKAEVYDNAEGTGNVVATIESGALLGELSMIADIPYAVTVKTVSAFAAQRIERNIFVRVATEFPEFGERVMRNLAKKVETSAAAFRSAKPLFD